MKVQSFYGVYVTRVHGQFWLYLGQYRQAS